VAAAIALKEEAMQTESSTTSDLDVLRDLNDKYIQAVRTSDVGWFAAMLGADFQCSLPDGALIDRERFLERAARPLDVTDLQVHDVNVRLLGEVAIVHARTSYTAPDGRRGAGRYTDVWARRDGRWLAVAAHFTRAAS
jgi:ketosteroid isomerase-like protein